MDYETLLVKTINYESPGEIPMRCGILPAVWKKYPEEIREIVDEFPLFFGDWYKNYDYDRQLPASYHTGAFKDEWGCEWTNIEEGMESIVTGHPVPTRADIRALQIPPNRDGRIPHGFMWLRLLDLRGFEEAMFDFAEECVELQMLIDKVVEHTLIQVDVALKNAGRVMYFGDDLGMQESLAISPAKWRKYLKPAFAKIYAPVRAAGKLIYMHTDGHIHEIIPDLFECGVNMVNPQIRANGLDNLARVCKGRYPMMLDLDRQLFPFTNPEGCRAHVRECVETLSLPSGGLGLNIEIGPDVPPENIRALLQTAEEYRKM
ncbi:MAG: hypothetical protein FWG05_04860 [Kiritimatiellaeota bacterium]|nr:hypothetical protein [Kiritimatiellota bacterium]